MPGTLVNAGCIVVGSLVGSLLESKLDDKFQNALYGALGLVTVALGANMCIQHLPKSGYHVLSLRIHPLFLPILADFPISTTFVKFANKDCPSFDVATEL